MKKKVHHFKKFDQSTLSQAVLEAAERAGKQFGDKGLVSYLEAQAIATPSPFMSLLTKAICKDAEDEYHSVTHIEIIAAKSETISK